MGRRGRKTGRMKREIEGKKEGVQEVFMVSLLGFSILLLKCAVIPVLLTAPLYQK